MEPSWTSRMRVRPPNPTTRSSTVVSNTVSGSITESKEENVAEHTARRVTRLRPPQFFSDYSELVSMSDDNGTIRAFVQDPTGQHALLHHPLQLASSALHTEDSDAQEYEAEDEDDDDEEFHEPSHRQTRTQKRKRETSKRDHSLDDFIVGDDETDEERVKHRKVATRQSARSTRHQGGMQEKSIDDIYRSDDEDASFQAPPRAARVHEVFKPVDENSDFCTRHIDFCDQCDAPDDLIYCQGCSLAYHQDCLGPRVSRGHTVTKVGEGNFVLQCKHCTGKDTTANQPAPHGGKCEDCLCYGRTCLPFGAPLRLLLEDEECDQSGAEDAITSVNPSLINNAGHVLFRCRGCYRAWHVEHLPLHWTEQDGYELRYIQARLRQYCQDWSCNDCAHFPSKVAVIIAWRPRDDDAFDEPLSYAFVDEDQKEYLVKFEGDSYFRAVWVSGAWLWRRTTGTQRKAFAKCEANQEAKLTAEAAIPSEYLRAEVILAVKFHPHGDSINDIAEVFVKFEGLPYEECSWDSAPYEENAEIWDAFERAYEDWEKGSYMQPVQADVLQRRLDAVRGLPFRQFQLQPISLKGKLMDYQLAGLNWLYFHWFSHENTILGDEMGLGKTVQVIALMAGLVERHQCYPFIIVVPNSTCPNWRREFARWAPGLKVATFFGSKKTRDTVRDYEMFPGDGKDLKCHVVITSYETASDRSTRLLFRKIKWQGLIVDEGQRLKNDTSHLYGVLAAMKTPFKALLTGTPLQNNQRELFNLLQFLDRQHNAAKLAEQYQDLNKDKITKLHSVIKPYFLRRTKLQVLSLPPMRQIVVPISMSSVQKRVYKTILTKNADLMKALLATRNGRKTNRTNHNNILMQLRKCLCHAYVYSQGIEERSIDQTVSLRNLIDASGKLKFLEVMLPLLQADGHRVLIFSQFLDALDVVEDFLNGLKMKYHRLDGGVSAQEKQKRIDLFNAADSQYFAFLLSTRSGGVGINLASADTVIILDPDFNPHQDLQAISRAHRFGQTKPVLCFKLVTVGTAEERIMSMGKRKLALDKALIRELDQEELGKSDLVSILQHGVNDLFSDTEGQTIVYDEAKVSVLLDRSNMTQDKDDEDNIWSYAEVWKTGEENELHEDAWDKILKDRERRAARAAAQQTNRLGRGRRQRGEIDYTGRAPFEDVEGLGPLEVDSRGELEEDDQDFHDNSDPESDEDGAVRAGRKKDGNSD
ncbi:hypothetical protein AMS68_000353 [Peltaster fructicola]|uniref:PHD-type domain-containing protein n=1 Tax=Peltaster fructicola TaxID=286661 RepID=A0A6H0XJE4_9PEZI|nr:hypothetical protein AMS68_000353 [Peltaster fructicola]